MIRKVFGNVCVFAGVVLLLTSALLTYRNYAEEENAETASSKVLQKLDREMGIIPGTELLRTETDDPQSTIELLPEYMRYPNIQMPVIRINGHDYIGTISIPELEIRLPVMSIWSYPNLKIAPCRFSGSAYQGNMIVCAHNYRRHFRKIGTLNTGDEIVFEDVDGNVFVYTVVEKEILFPNEAEELISGDWDITLFTCTLGGRTRIVVRCKSTQG